MYMKKIKDLTNQRYNLLTVIEKTDRRIGGSVVWKCVCDCGNSTEACAFFLEDMGERPTGKTLDRIDVNGNYEPSNCRWATIQEQHNNKRGNRKFNYNGETLTISQLARKYEIDRAKLSYRLKSGWPIDKALNTK